MWKWYTAKDRREAALFVLVLAVLAALVTAASLALPAIVLAGASPSPELFSRVFEAIAGNPVEGLWPGVSPVLYWRRTPALLCDDTEGTQCGKIRLDPSLGA